MGGEIVAELNGAGEKIVGYASLPGRQLLATQTSGTVTWKHNTPAGTTEYTASSAEAGIGRTEFDPIGADVSLTQPPAPPPNQGNGDIGSGYVGGIMDQRWADMFNLNSGFVLDGFAAPASEAMFFINFGGGRSAPETVGLNAEDKAETTTHLSTEILRRWQSIFVKNKLAPCCDERLSSEYRSSTFDYRLAVFTRSTSTTATP